MSLSALCVSPSPSFRAEETEHGHYYATHYGCTYDYEPQVPATIFRQEHGVLLINFRLSIIYIYNVIIWHMHVMQLNRYVVSTILVIMGCLVQALAALGIDYVQFVT